METPTASLAGQLTTSTQNINEATPASSEQLNSQYESTAAESVADKIHLIEAKTTASSIMTTTAAGLTALIPTSGFFATLMKSFLASAPRTAPAPTISNSTDNAPDFVLKRLAQSFISAVAQQTAETDIHDPKVSTFVSYLVSPFAILCICMAILLNRTVVFATTRRPAPLNFAYRLILRSVAIFFLSTRTASLITAIKCTSSPLANYIPSYFAAEKCPSPAILWDLYWAICVGHFIETFSSVIQGQTPHSETGMTLFEYSMAFQEVQSARHMSIEVLIVAITSAFSLISLHIFGIFNIYNYRLIPSTIFGASFLAYFGWSVFNGRIFYFPTVCIIGYLPQLMLSLIIAVCGSIYGLSSLLSGGPGNLTTSWKHVNISLKDDFYSCLFKIGVVALTTASQAAFVNETALIKQPTFTWIEKEDQEERTSEPPKPFNYQMISLAPSLLHATPEEISRYAQASAIKSTSPYNNETTLPPDLAAMRKQKRQNASEPPKLLTLYRITAVFRMLQGIVVILLHLVVRLTWNLGFKYLWSKKKDSNSQTDGIERFMEQIDYERLENVKNQVIYSPMEDGDKENGYQQLLWGRLIPDIDNSNDYEDVSEDGFSTDEEGLEYESDYEGGSSTSRSVDYVAHVSQQRSHFSRSASAFAEKPRSTLEDLYQLLMPTPHDILALLSPQTPDQVEHKRMLISHLEDEMGEGTKDAKVQATATTLRRRPVTRSQYKQRTWNESKALLHTIESRRRKFVVDDEIRETLCVVCQCSARQVILWPCRCLAVCEECRMALVAQNFKGCVCCRRDVKSFSRIFVP